jgi:hypothetical protein
MEITKFLISRSMICFAEYFKRSLTEAKFRKISFDVEEAAKKCVDLYLKKYHGKTQKQIDKITVPTSVVTTWKKYFKTSKITNVSIAEKIKVVDLTTNEEKTIDFLVAFGKYDGPLGYYDQVNEFIVLFDYQAEDLSHTELLATLVHELTHSFQQYKSQSEEYGEEVEKMSKGKKYDPNIYFMEPLELDAHLTELAFRIKKDFQKLIGDIKASKQEVTKNIMKKRLEKFLLELKVFIKSGAETYFEYEELPIPEFLSRHDEFVETLKDHPKEWKKFKQRLVDLYTKLEEEQKNI